MLKLKIQKEPYWLELGSGVKVKVKPCNSAVFYEAKAFMNNRVAETAKLYKSNKENGIQDPSIPNLEDVSKREAFADQNLILGLALAGIIEWDGVLEAESDEKAPLTPEKIEELSMAFDLELPPVEAISVPEITLSLDNVSTEIIKYLDQTIETQDMIEMTYRPYLSDDLTCPQMDPPITLVITEINADILKITAKARMMDIGNKSFPAENYTVKKYPGLSR